MIISYGNSWALVEEARSEEVDWLDQYTSVEYRDYARGKTFKSQEDPRYRMYDRVTHLFPAGFVRPLVQAATQDGVSLTVQDLRVPPCRGIELDQKLCPWLRDYQWEALVAAVKSQRGLIKVPTAGGKTEIHIGMTRIVPCEWLFVVHRSDLVEQTRARYSLRTLERAGSFTNGEWRRGSCNLTVATFQSIMYAVRKKLPGVQELLHGIQAVNVDETHAQPADSFYAVTMAMENAYYRIGQSGTPLDRSEKDSLRTIGALGTLVYSIPAQRLIRAGLLSKAKIRMVPFKHPPTAPESTWRQVYNDYIVHNFDRNSLIADMAMMAAKPCLLFVQEYEHGRHLKELMEARGLRVDFAHGQHWLGQRQAKIKALVEGRTDVLLTTVIFQEGIDIPELMSVVVGTGMSSVVAALQRIGRGMRTSAGKDTFEVWDVLDRGQDWLTAHATARKSAYEKEGHQVDETRLEQLSLDV